jgi:ceramide glucosyltransferase
MTPCRLLFTVSLVIGVLSLALTTLAHVFTWWQICVGRGHGRGNRRSTQAIDEASPSPRLTLLKPMCGVDAALANNLQTIAQQTYSNFDVVFGAADRWEPALEYARQFTRRFPNLTSTFSFGQTNGCINPKVSLLAHMTIRHRRPCSNHWYVVSDSNVQLLPDYLEEAVSHMAPDVGLVTHLVAGCGGDNLAAAFENLQLNASITPAVAFVRYVTGRTCVIGKSIFIRADVLANLGGFQAIGGVLAEDYLLGREVARAGMKVVISTRTVRAWHEQWSWGRFFNRHGRWACMRRNISLTGYLLEPLLAPCFALTCAWSIGRILYEPGFDVDAIGLGIVWSMALAGMTTRVLSGEWGGSVNAVLNPIRECLTLAIWVKGWFIRHIEWRGKSYFVLADSVLRPVNGEFSDGDELPVR